MRRKIELLLIISVLCLLQSCNEACVCTVKWVEYQEVSSGYYNQHERQETYVVYTKDEYTTCEQVLDQQYHISYDYGYNNRFYNNGITYVDCRYKP